MFHDAWNHPDAKSQRKWKETNKKEFNDMTRQQVWHKTTKDLMPANNRCIKCKDQVQLHVSGLSSSMWLQSGARCYSSENYSPVVNKITFKMLLLIIELGFFAKIVNVKTVFLYGEFEEEVYMECPPRMKNVSKN